MEDESLDIVSKIEYGPRKKDLEYKVPPPSRHRQTEIVLKRAIVDDRIIPVLEWLNSFHGVYTIWSCQGQDSDHLGGDSYLPYISFISACRNDLSTIKAKVAVFAQEKLTCENNSNSITLLENWPRKPKKDDSCCHHLHLGCEQDLVDFIEFLKPKTPKAFRYLQEMNCEKD
jgi:hypothetical protein